MSNDILRFARKTHLYFGLLIAPSLMFFAVTGAIQTFNFHEEMAGSSYKPSPLVQRLAQIHKNQNAVVPPARQPQPPQPGAPAKPARPQGGKSRTSHLPLKLFFLLVSIGLFWSSLTGIYMAYRYTSRKWVVTVWWVAGLVIPLVLLKF